MVDACAQIWAGSDSYLSYLFLVFESAHAKNKWKLLIGESSLLINSKGRSHTELDSLVLIKQLFSW